MYTLEPINPKIAVLQFNGNLCYCPYAAGQMQTPCSQLCPQFEVNTKSTALGAGWEKTASTVTLHCTGRQITIGETA